MLIQDRFIFAIKAFIRIDQNGLDTIPDKLINILLPFYLFLVEEKRGVQPGTVQLFCKHSHGEFMYRDSFCAHSQL
jgi:hypothetical protein